MPDQPATTENTTTQDAEYQAPDHVGEITEHPFPDLKKLSQIDSAILAVKRLNPGMTAYEIGKQLKKHKVSQNRMTVYTRLKANDYLRSEFHALEKYHREALIREDYPLARKKLRKILKNQGDKIPAAVEMQAIKLVYDKSLADRQDKSIDSPVQIQNIEKLQILVQHDITDS